MSRWWIAGLVVLTGCFVRPMDDGVFFVETGGAQCWRSSSASGLVRLLKSDVQVVLTASEPSAYTFNEVLLVSGGTMVEETISEAEAVLRVTPEAETTPVVITAQLHCASQWGDTASPPLRFEILASTLSEEWSITSPEF
ncbi:MAG: hypothetical protein KC912_16455 [Proteobacteria bacterium]|nr:hypothetical protein [Pseudomonadota bacterium]